ncbi:hypothetical protein BGX27_000118 [Mortierella sp. AM989]|nr:hypothetical protein BGX27_000118 [Mortierella sp. AM989]
MSNDIYTRISERMKQEHFTEEEIKIVKKAKEQISSYTRAKNFKGIQSMMIATGGFFIGSQIGLIMGAMSSVRTIQSIPNFQRVLNIVQEVRTETSSQGGQSGQPQHDRATAFPSARHQRPSTQQSRSELITDYAVDQQNHQFEGFKDGDGYHGGDDPSGQARNDQNTAWSQASQRAKELRSHSNHWDQIRQQSMPKSAWNDVRGGNHRSTTTNGDIAEEIPSGGSKKTEGGKPALSAWDRVRKSDTNGLTDSGTTYDGPSDFARTREDLESKPSRQKNQYGDML